MENSIDLPVSEIGQLLGSQLKAVVDVVLPIKKISNAKFLEQTWSLGHFKVVYLK